MSPESQDFDVAPMSWLRRFSFPEIWALAVAVVVADALMLIKAQSRHVSLGDYMTPIYGALLGVVVTPWRNRIRRFRIEDGALQVGKERYPLDGLREAARDRTAMDGARRLRCAYPFWRPRALGDHAKNGGMQRYTSARLGEFRGCVTDPEKAVVLRWPDQTIVLSPADPEFFVLLARKAGGLR